MNFKIENKTLNITNYPIIAKHFEVMAAKGWLIQKIAFDPWFIYKKIKPEELDFSIIPYEVERIFTRSSKGELEEFQNACKEAGWNYAAKSNEFHIYFKQASSLAEDLETDTEEELNTLEKIARKQITGNLMLMALFAFLMLYIFKLNYIHIEVMRPMFDIVFMKSSLVQILTLVGPLFFINTIITLYKMYKFIKINKENIEIGRPIQYNRSKNNIERFTSYAILILIIICIIYIGYQGIVLKDITMLSFIIPYTAAVSIPWFYRIFIKPSNKSYDFKVISFLATIILAIGVAMTIQSSRIGSLTNKTDPNLTGLKVMTAADFNDKDSDMVGELKKDFSFIIPESYEYIDFTKYSYIVTEYTRSLNEKTAKYIVKQYIYRGESKIIVNEDKGLPKADEAYFLRNDKKKIIIRQGKEVFMLEGLDFSDKEVIQIVANKLGLE